MTLAELESILRGVLTSHDEIRFAILFGSCGTRGPEAARDVDVALAFSSAPSLMEVGTLALELERSVGKPVDIVDVGEASTLLRWEIVRTGRDLLARDADALLAFRATVPIEHADLRPYLDREAAGLRRVLAVR
jgi:predicted nucleotidyltransferase